MDTPGPQDEATIKALKERQEADAAKSKWTSKLAKQRGLRWKRKTAKTSKAGGKKLKGRRSGGPTPPARRRFGEWCRAGPPRKLPARPSRHTGGAHCGCGWREWARTELENVGKSQPVLKIWIDAMTCCPPAPVAGTQASAGCGRRPASLRSARRLASAWARRGRRWTTPAGSFPPGPSGAISRRRWRRR
jgi:hypothetical protein